MPPVKSTFPPPNTLFNKSKFKEDWRRHLIFQLDFGLLRASRKYITALLNIFGLFSVLARPWLLSYLNVRYSLSTTPLRIVFISGIPDPIAWKDQCFRWGGLQRSVSIEINDTTEGNLFKSYDSKVQIFWISEAIKSPKGSPWLNIKLKLPEELLHVQIRLKTKQGRPEEKPVAKLGRTLQLRKKTA